MLTLRADHLQQQNMTSKQSFNVHQSRLYLGDRKHIFRGCDNGKVDVFEVCVWWCRVSYCTWAKFASWPDSEVSPPSSSPDSILIFHHRHQNHPHFTTALPLSPPALLQRHLREKKNQFHDSAPNPLPTVLRHPPPSKTRARPQPRRRTTSSTH